MISQAPRKTNSELTEDRVFLLNRDVAEGIALNWLFAESRVERVAPAGCTKCDSPSRIHAVTVAVGLAVIRVPSDGSPVKVSRTFNAGSYGGVEVEHLCTACGHISAMTHSAEMAGDPRLWQENADNLEGDQ